uniref:(northern house mosquito) hypothetical protein n=1 Tax=Culex pipiens TaxID=7175 RepID=A0A8D8FHN7_CULPI
MVSSPAEEALSRITCHSRNRRRCSLLVHQSSNSDGLSSCLRRSRRQRRMYSARLCRWMTIFSVSPGAGDRTGGRPTKPNEEDTATGVVGADVGVCCWDWLRLARHLRMYSARDRRTAAMCCSELGEVWRLDSPPSSSIGSG